MRLLRSKDAAKPMTKKAEIDGKLYCTINLTQVMMCPDPAKMINQTLTEAGFDLTKPYQQHESENTYEKVFIQEI